MRKETNIEVEVPHTWLKELQRQYHRLVKTESKSTFTFDQFVELAFHIGLEKLRNMNVQQVLKFLEKGNF